MTSFKKKDANRRNAAKSTGPKTETGKRRVSLNALSHGFYSRELRVSEPDKQDFETLRENLVVQLAPRTALQSIAFEQIVACCWRCKLAIRLEMHRLKVRFTEDDESTSSETDPQRDIREAQWYGASSAALRDGIRLLNDLHTDVYNNGPLHLDKRKDEISKAFGVGFYDALTEWKPMSRDEILLAEQLTRHASTFKKPLPASFMPPEGGEIIADPKLKQNMLVKLIELQIQHLSDLQRINSGGSQMGQTAPNEFVPRYFATASRDLQRAVDWYLYLGSKDL